MASSGGYLKSSAKKSHFVVLYSTGNEEEYPAKDLEICSPFTRGWRSPRFCLYPQEIILQLDQAARIRMVQLLSHNSMIASKVEFFISTKYRPNDHTTFTRLGYVSFSDNQSSNYKTRELKSVYVDCFGTYIKLVLHSNHINKWNLYNQVGLVAINVLADTSSKIPFSVSEETELTSLSRPQDLDVGLDVLDHNLQVLLNEPLNVSHTDDITFAITYDPVIAELIQKLDRRKKLAVKAEQFEEARKLKYIIDELSKESEAFCKFELDKREAVRKENYDAAQKIKVKMDYARDALYKRLQISKVIDDLGHNESKDSRKMEPELLSPNQYQPIKKERSYTDLITHEDSVLSFEEEESLEEQEQRVTEGLANFSIQRNPEKPIFAADFQQPQESSQIKKTFTSDILPLKIRIRGANLQPAAPGEGSVESNDDIDGDVLVASEVFGKDVISKMNSKKHADKKEVFLFVMDFLKSLKDEASSSQASKLPKLSKIVTAASQVVARGLREKFFSLFSWSQELLMYLIGDFALLHSLRKPDYCEIVGNVLPVLLLAAGDTSSRISSAAIESVSQLSRHEVIKDLHIIGPMLTKRFDKTKVPFSLIIGRLVLLQKFVSDPCISSELTNIMQYAIQYMEHNSARVREEASELIVRLYHINPSKIKSMLPVGDNSGKQRMIRKNLIERFNTVDKQLNRKTSSETVTIKRPSVSVERKPDQPDSSQQKTSLKDKLNRTCVFCGLEKEEFLEAARLEEHYCKNCLMLHSCTHCGQFVEVSTLKQHMLRDCKFHDKFVECSTCEEAILKDEYSQHREKGCYHKPPKGSSFCQLCHISVRMTENSWKRHLMGDKDGPATCKNRVKAQ